jgi:hypothetical protein
MYGGIDTQYGIGKQLCLHLRKIVIRGWKDKKDLVLIAPIQRHFERALKMLNLTEKTLEDISFYRREV